MEKKKKRRKWILPVCAAAILLLVIQPLYTLGINFSGPWRHLAVSKIVRKYPASDYQNGVVFYGASNFARWKDMENVISSYPVQNHGFGGSADRDLIQYADELLYPYSPRIVVFQTGSNDYVQEEGTDAEKELKCMNRKREMFTAFHEQLPNARFVVMSGLLLPGRSEYLELTREVNRQLEALCEELDYLSFVDASDMTYQDGKFAEELFVKDGIHLNSDGQRIWAEQYIIPALDALCAQYGIPFGNEDD